MSVPTLAQRSRDLLDSLTLVNMTVWHGLVNHKTGWHILSGKLSYRRQRLHGVEGAHQALQLSKIPGIGSNLCRCPHKCGHCVESGCPETDVVEIDSVKLIVLRAKDSSLQ